jgi:hypothetical protein
VAQTARLRQACGVVITEAKQNRLKERLRVLQYGDEQSRYGRAVKKFALLPDSLGRPGRRNLTDCAIAVVCDPDARAIKENTQRAESR